MSDALTIETEQEIRDLLWQAAAIEARMYLPETPARERYKLQARRDELVNVAALLRKMTKEELNVQEGS